MHTHTTGHPTSTQRTCPRRAHKTHSPTLIPPHIPPTHTSAHTAPRSAFFFSFAFSSSSLTAPGRSGERRKRTKRRRRRTGGKGWHGRLPHCSCLLFILFFLHIDFRQVSLPPGYLATVLRTIRFLADNSACSSSLKFHAINQRGLCYPILSPISRGLSSSVNFPFSSPSTGYCMVSHAFSQSSLSSRSVVCMQVNTHKVFTFFFSFFPFFYSYIG